MLGHTLKEKKEKKQGGGGGGGGESDHLQTWISMKA